MTEYSVSDQQTDRASRPTLDPDLSAVVTLNLPNDLAFAIEQHRQQSGQAVIEAILNLLRSALELPAAPKITQPGAEATQPSMAEKLEAILARLQQIEAFIPRIEALEGKSIAF